VPVKVTLETDAARSLPSTSQRVLTMSPFGSEVVAVNARGVPQVAVVETAMLAVGGRERPRGGDHSSSS
jgi:hypothetical protein